MKQKQHQICAQCVMDTSDPDIRFDEKGVCNHCIEFQHIKNKYDSSKLENIFEKIKKSNHGGKYDCVIGLSGGVDSTYTALKTCELGLRPLAVHFDNGWNSELAVNNIENIVKKLGIDLHTHVVDWEEFKDLQLAFLKSGVPNTETPSDHGILATMYRAAAQYGIKWIISGGNIATEAIMPRSWEYNYHIDLKLLKKLHEKFGTKKLATYPTMGLTRYLYYKLMKRIHEFRLLNYIPYIKETAKKEISDKLGWRDYGGKHYESIFTRFHQSYLLPTRFGYDKRRPHLSTLICSGQLNKTQAEKELRQPLYDIKQLEEDKNYVKKKLGITEEEFEKMLTPSQDYKKYPSNRWLIDALYSIKRS